jgi:hypothetical protein
MNRRDLIIVFIILVWGGLWIFLVNIFCEYMTSDEIIATFACTLLMMVVSLTVLIVLSLLIKPFGKWGDKKLIDKRKIAHRRWQRRRDRAWRISCIKASGYNEDVDACDPMFYFWNELDGLKKKKK